MSNVEERIVQLTMNSKDFERNTKTSIAALEKLDEALRLTGSKQSMKELQASVNNVDFSKLSNSVDKINRRFSAFGIAGATVIANLTNRATDFGIKMLNSINPVTQSIKLLNQGINQIKTGGWTRATKIDKAQFKIEGLGEDWEKVSQRIDYGVSETAYGFDQAANAAAQLVASGVKMSDVWDENNIDDLGVSLRAISGVASMTSANYDLLADIFVDAAAAGKVTADTFNRISAQGLNAKATLAKALDKTQAEIDEMSRKGQISFQEFAKAMDEAYGDQSKKSNKTFEGSFDNMKAALNRIGAEFAFPIRKAGTQIFNATRLQLNAFKKLLGSTTDDVKDDFVDKFANVIEKGSDVIDRFISSIPVDSFKAIIDYGSQALDTILGMIDGINTLMDTVPWLAKKEEEQVKDTTDAVEAGVDAEAKILELANQVIRGDFGNGEERVQALGKMYKLIQNKVNEIYDNPKRYELEADETAEALFGVGEGAEQATKNVIKLHEAQEDLTVVKDMGVWGSFKNVSNTEKATTAIEGFKAALEVLGKTAASIGTGAKDPIIDFGKSIGQAFLDAGYSIGNWIINFRTWLDESGAYEKISSKINEATGWIVDKLKVVGGLGKKAFALIRNAVGKAWTAIGQLRERIGEFFTSFKNTEGYTRLSDTFTKVRDKVLEVKETIVSAISDAITRFMGTEIKLPEFDADAFASSVSDKVTWVLDHLESIKNTITTFFVGTGEEGNGGLFGFIQDVLGSQTFQDAVNWANTSLSTLHQNILNFIHSLTGETVPTRSVDSSIELLEEEKTIGEYLSPHLQNVIDTLTGFKDNLVEVGQMLVDAILGIFRSIVEAFTGTSSSEIDDSASVGAMTEEHLETEAEKIEETIDTVQSHFDTIKEKIQTFVDGITEAVAPLAEFMPGSISDVVDVAHNVVDTVKDFAKDLAVIGIYKGVWNFSGILGGVSKTTKHGDKVVKALAKFLDKAKVLPGKIGKFIDNIGTSLKKLAKSEARLRNAKALLLISASIAILVGAIYAIAQLKPSELARGVRVLGIIALILGALFAVIGLFFGNKGSGDINGVPAKLTETLDACKAIFKDFLKNISKAALIASIGIAVSLIAGVIVMLGSMDWKVALRGVGFLALILGGLLGSMYLLGKIGGDDKSKITASMALMMLFLAFAVRSLAGTIEKLGKMNVGVLLQGGAAVSALLYVASLAIKNINTVPVGSQQKGGFSKILAIGMLILAIKSLANDVKMLGEMDTLSLVKGVVAVDLLMLFLRRLVTANIKVQPKTFTAYLGIAIILGTMTAITKILGELDLFTLGKGITAVAIFGLILKGILTATKGVNKNALMAFVGIAAVIGTVALSLYALSTVDPHRLKTAAKSLRSTMLMIGASISAILYTTKSNSKGQMLSTFIPLIGVVIAIAGALYALSGRDSKSLRTAARSIKRVFVALGTFTKQFSKLGPVTKGNGPAEIGRIIAFFGMITVLLYAVVGALHLVKDIPTAQLLAMGTVLSSIFGTLGILAQGVGMLGGTGGGIGFLSNLGSSFGHSFGAITGFLLGLSGVAVLVGALVEITGGKNSPILDALDGAILFFEKLGILLGSFLGNLLGGVIGSVSDSLKGFGENFEVFVEKLAEFGKELVGAGGTDSDFMTGIEALSEFMDAIKDIAWDTFVSGVTSKFATLVQGDIIKFMDNLIAMAPKIPELIGAFKEGTEYDSGVMEDAETSAEQIISLVKILQAIGGVGFVSFASGFLSWVANSNFGEIDKFVTNLTALADPVYEMIEAFKEGKTSKGTIKEGDASWVASQVRAIRNIVIAIGDAADLGDANSWHAFLDANTYKDDMLEFVGNLQDLAGPVYLLADAFENIQIKNARGQVIATISAKPKEIATKIAAIRDIVEAVGDTAWVSDAAGWHAKKAIDDSDIGNIEQFCTNLVSVSEPAYKLADAFANGDGFEGDVTESQIPTIEERLRAVASVLRVIQEVGLTTVEVGETALDAINDASNIATFCTNLATIGQPAYTAAYMFSNLTTESGDTITDVNEDDIKQKLLAVLAVIEAIGSIGHAVGFTGIAINDSGDEETVKQIGEFCKHVSAVALPAYNLAYAFEHITDDTGAVVADVVVDDLVKKLNAVLNVMLALADIGGVTLDAGIKAKSNLNSTSIDDISKFCTDMIPLAGPILQLAQMFENVEVDGEEVKDITPEDVQNKLEAIKAVVEGLGKLGLKTFVSGVATSLNEFGATDDTGGWSIQWLDEFITHMNELKPKVEDLIKMFGAEDAPKLDSDTILNSVADLTDQNGVVFSDEAFEPIKTAIQGIVDLSYLGMQINNDGLGRLAVNGNDIGKFADGLTKYFEAIKGIDSPMRYIQAQPAVNGLISSMNSIGEYAAQRAGSLGNVLGSVGTGIAAFFTNAGTVSFSDAASFATDFATFITGLNSVWDNAGYSWEVTPGAMDLVFSQLGQHIHEVFDQYTAIVSEGKYDDVLGNLGQAIMHSVAKGMLLTPEDMQMVIDNFLDAATGSEESGKVNAEEFTLGFKRELSLLSPETGVCAATSVEENVAPAVEGTSGTFEDAVVTIMNAMKLKMSSYRWTLTETMASILNSVVRLARTFNTDFVNVGKYLIDGLITGLKDPDKSTALSQTVRQIGEGMVRDMKESTQVNSPSKATMEIGRYLMEGLRIGIVDNVTPVDRAATLSAASIVRTMSDSVTTEADNTKQQLFNSLVGLYSLVNMAINEAVDTQPTITPVMDLSMIQNGVNGINGMLGRGYSFGANSLAYARNMFPGTTAYNAQTAAQMGTQSAIQGIREDIRYLGETIGNMQMVLDSGTLVGSISGGMDKQLGGMQRMKERWA